MAENNFETKTESANPRFLRATSMGMVAVLALGGLAFPLASCSPAPATDTQAATEKNGSIAATVNGSPIYENEVSERIATQRIDGGWQDDKVWAQHIVDNGWTVEAVRATAIQELAYEKISAEYAAENGAKVDQSQVDTQVADARKAMVGQQGSDEEWAAFLQGQGYIDEQAYKEHVRSVLEASSASSTQATTEGNKKASEQADVVTKTLASWGDQINGAAGFSVLVLDGDATSGEDSDYAKAMAAATTDFDAAVEEYSVMTGGVKTFSFATPLPSEVTEKVKEAVDAGKTGMLDPVLGIDGHSYVVNIDTIIPQNALSLLASEGQAALANLPERLVEYANDRVNEAAAGDAAATEIYKRLGEADIQINEMPEGLPYFVDITGLEPTPGTDAAKRAEEASKQEIPVIEEESSNTVSGEGGTATGALADGQQVTLN